MVKYIKKSKKNWIKQKTLAECQFNFWLIEKSEMYGFEYKNLYGSLKFESFF